MAADRDSKAAQKEDGGKEGSRGHSERKREQVERATDKIKEKFGKSAILKGRALR